jgi:NDP-sugar pyrophosphorylase family protein
VPVNGEPLVRRVIRWLVDQRISDLVLNLHHRPETITAVTGDGLDVGARIRYSWEQPILGSGGGPRHALPLLVGPSLSGTFLLINGDTLTNLSIDGLLKEHSASGAAVTMALIPNPAPDKYGGVAVADGWVTGFTRRGVARQSFHFIGVQAAEAAAFASVDDGIPFESVAGLYPKLIAADRHSVRAFVSNASFDDIGTPLDYLRTSSRLAVREGTRLASGARTVVAPSAVLSRTVLWDDVAIGERARLADCIVCDGARVPDDACYKGCAILPAAGRTPSACGRIDEDLLIEPIGGIP